MQGQGSPSKAPTPQSGPFPRALRQHWADRLFLARKPHLWPDGRLGAAWRLVGGQADAAFGLRNLGGGRALQTSKPSAVLVSPCPLPKHRWVGGLCIASMGPIYSKLLSAIKSVPGT